MSPENKALMERYPQYYHDVSHLEVIDVYRVIDLFGVTDPTAQHALKKLLLSGERTGGKSIEVDLKEARDTLTRGLAMRNEDKNKHQLGFDFAAPGTDSVTINNFDPVTPPGPWPVQTGGDELVMVQLGANDSDKPAHVHKAVQFCSQQGCEMRVRDNSDRCMIHCIPQIPPVVVRHKFWCDEKCAASACSCQHMPDPSHGRYCAIGSCGKESVKEGLCESHFHEVSQLEAETRPLHSGPAAAPRRTR